MTAARICSRRSSVTRPARVAVEVAELPLAAAVEVEMVVAVSD